MNFIQKTHLSIITKKTGKIQSNLWHFFNHINFPRGFYIIIIAYFIKTLITEILFSIFMEKTLKNCYNYKKVVIIYKS